MDVNAIFDAFGKFSELTNLSEQYQDKQAQIASVNARRCGNCNHWMKTSCIPEKKHKQFKSTHSVACGAFTLDAGSKRLSDDFTIELQAIGEKLKAFRSSPVSEST